MVSGVLDASGGAGVHGGTIKVLGDAVGLVGQAHLDASGGTGGGTLLVGGNFHGQGTEQDASNTFVGSGVVLDANATTKGNGGTVVVWADNHTSYGGQLNARGGSIGGDGGQAEVSGKQTLDFQGGSNLTAPKGKTGGLLLDPATITIGTTADLNGNGVFGDDVTNLGIAATDFGPRADSLITAATVGTLLATNSLSLAANNSITVSTAVNVAAGRSPTTLTLTTGTININAGLNLNNTSLVTNSSSVAIAAGAPVSSSNSISMTANDISIGAPLSAATMFLLNNTTDNRNINQTAAGPVNAGTLTIGGSPGNPGWDNVNLGVANNKIGNLSIDSFNANLHVANSPGVPLSISGTVDDLTLITDNTDVTQGLAPLGALTIGAGEGFFNLITNGTGNVSLNNPQNSFLSSVNFNVAGNISLVGAGALFIEGQATGNVTAKASGVLDTSDVVRGANIDLTGAGIVTDDGNLVTPAGGRFFLRSSDFTQDDLGSLAFNTQTNQVNYVVLGGYTGPDPTSGNGYYTNRTGTITPPVTDNAPVSKVYDGNPNFAYGQSGAAATGLLTGARTGFALTGYNVTSTGAFTDKNAGTNKGLTVAASNNTSAVASTGGVYYGLQFASYTRAPGAHSPGSPGNDISQITPKPITSTGVDGIDRTYNGTTAVGINIAGASLVGAIAGDNVALSAATATGTLADKNVGVNKAVTVAGLTLTGTDAANYTVTDASVAPNATISQLAITSQGIVAINRVYDGTTTVASTAQVRRWSA